MGKIEDLEKIHELKTKGILTEEEFEEEKKKILKHEDLDVKETLIEENNLCKKCGANLQEGEKFCGKCGKKVENIAEITRTSDKKEFLEKSKKVVLVSLITCITSFVVTGLTADGNPFIWNIAKLIFFISLIVYCIGILYCTIISKKNKQKLNGWIGVVQTLTFSILIVATIVGICTALSDRDWNKKTKANSVAVQLQLSFNGSEAEYVETYKGYYICKITLSSGETYYAAGDGNSQYITKTAKKYYTETDNRIIYTNDAGTILTIYKTTDESGKKLSVNKIYITLFESKNDLKENIENE